MRLIDIHVDDFALSKNNSMNIFRCIKDQKINSISIIPNMSSFKKCMKLLDKTVKIEKSIHLNFLEGKSISNKMDVSNLVDENGYFKLSWIKIFYYSFNPFTYNKLKKQFKIEIKNQIEVIMPYINNIRIDSHQHTHMIPIVFNSLIEVINEEKYMVEFIRVSKEPIFPFIKNFKLYSTYDFKKIISNIILNFLSIRIIRKLKKLKINYSYLWGIIMSGMMDEKRIEILKNDVLNSVNNNSLEILFHCGKVLKKELNADFVKKDFNAFHTSKNRDMEFNTLHNINISYNK